MLGGARWSAMLGGAKGTRTHVCARPCTCVNVYVNHEYILVIVSLCMCI